MKRLVAWYTRSSTALEKILFSPRAFFVFGGALLLYTVFGLVNLYCAGTDADYWEHLSFIKSFADDPLHPENPYFSPSPPIYLHAPFHLFWGLVCRAIGANPLLLSPLIGAVNVLLFLIAVRLFAERVIGGRRYALLLLLVFLFFWIKPWPWSGFYNFSLLPLTGVYPYRLAFPVTLIALSLYPGRSILAFVAFSVLTAFVILIHPITGSFLVVSLGIIALVEAWNSRRWKFLLWLAPPVLGLALAFFWPYFPILQGIFVSQKSLTADYRLFYEGVLKKLFPALPGVIYVALALRRRQFTYVSIGFLGLSLIYVGNYVIFHNVGISRYVLFVAFFLQVGLALLVKSFEESPLKPLVFTAVPALLVLGGAFELRESARYIGALQDLRSGTKLGYHSNLRLYRDYRHTFGPFLTDKDIVWARTHDSLLLPLFLGCEIVTIKQWQPNPYLPDDFATRRIADERRFFSDGVTAQERIAMLRSYRVTHAFLASDDGPFLAGMEAVLVRLAAGDGRTLYRFAAE